MFFFSFYIYSITEKVTQTDIVMTLILDGNSEIGTHVLNDYSICFWYLFRSRATTNLIFSLEKTCSELPTKISTIVIVFFCKLGYVLGCF